MVVGLLLHCQPCLGMDDMMPHYGTPTHVVIMVIWLTAHIGAGNYTFRLCKALSTATRWKAQLINVVTLTLPIADSRTNTTPKEHSPCMAVEIPAGTCARSITYKVPGGTFTHAHSYYIKP